MEKSPFSHSLLNCSMRSDIRCLIENSNSHHIKKLYTEITSSDFDTGEFSFLIKAKEAKVTYLLSFFNKKETMNEFWKFLEEICLTDEPLMLYILSKRREIIINAKAIPPNYTRFVIVEQSEIKLDIIMNTKKLVKSFYYPMRELFINYENIAYFEPPLIDYRYWIKNSEVIQKFIEKKKRRRVEKE